MVRDGMGCWMGWEGVGFEKKNQICFLNCWICGKQCRLNKFYIIK